MSAAHHTGMSHEPPKRTPAGVPAGGQFAASAKDQADVSLVDADETLPVGSRWHTKTPIQHLSLTAQNQRVIDVVRNVTDGHVTVDAPYQRGHVWTRDQQIGLVRSMLQGVAVPALIVNDRGNSEWGRHNGGYPDPGEPWQSVVDGKQRVEAMRAWFDGEVAVPASWFPVDDVDSTRAAADGTAWVTVDDLAPNAQARCRNRFSFPVAVAALGSVEAEAQMYLLVNGAGTVQSDDDLANAARVAGGRLDRATACRARHADRGPVRSGVQGPGGHVHPAATGTDRPT